MAPVTADLLAARIDRDLGEADAVVGVPVSTVWSAPDAPRPVDEAATRPEPDLAAWLAALATAERHVTGLHGRILTQALLGEPVRIVEERAGWSSVTCGWQPSSLGPHGYPGWVPTSHLRAATPRPAGACWQVVARRQVDPELGRAGTQPPLSYATIVAATETTEGRCRIEVGSRVLQVPVTTLAPLADTLPPTGGAALYTETLRFLGLGYLWGGLSGGGVDCSGLIHLVHRRLGVVLARDADDQGRCGAPVSPDELAVGDLAFFARAGQGIHHVGMVAGPGTRTGPGPGTAGARMVHAPMSGHQVTHVALTTPPYSEQLVALRRTAGRVSASG